MRRTISAAIAALLFCLFFAGNLGAVGLGQLRADSAINQPLNVRIQLIDLGSTPLEEIEIAIAAVENFKRLGVAVATNFPQIEIATGVDSDGAFARLTSSSLIGAAYLEVVLDTRWPSGRVLTQHTILLDPPVFAEDDGGLVENTAPTSPEAALDSADSAAAPVTVTTDRFSTLYSIAMAARPNSGLTVQQTMLAIQRINPRSFGSGNINRLYAGEILRLPTAEEVSELSATEALDDVRRQNQEAAGNVADDPVMDVNSWIEPAIKTGGQLNVVVTDTSILERENSALDARIEELENKLAISQEELARAARERTDFISRLEAIESQISAAQEIIRLQDEQLAELAQSLAAAAAREQVAAPLTAATAGGASSFLGQPFIAAAAAGIAVLLLVLLLLRRNRESQEPDGEEDVIKLDAVGNKSGPAATPQGKAASVQEAFENPAGESLLPTGGTDSEIDQDELHEELLAIFASGSEDDGFVEPASVAKSQPAALAFDPDELTFRAQDGVVETANQSAAGVIDEDEAATKLELAYAYHKMGDNAGAVEILLEVVEEGGLKHKDEAQKLLAVVNEIAERSRQGNAS